MLNLTRQHFQGAPVYGATIALINARHAPALLLALMTVFGPAYAQAQTVKTDPNPTHGRVISQKGPNGITTTTYDAQGRVVSVTTPDHKTSRQNYATSGTEDPSSIYDSFRANTDSTPAIVAKTSAPVTGSRTSAHATAKTASPASAPPQEQSPFTVAPAPGVKQTKPGRAVYDFGTVNPLDMPIARQTFLVQNTGKKPLTLDHVQTSCPCTTAVVGDGGKTLPTLQPGQQVPIHVTLALKGHGAGPLSQSVSVFLPGQSRAALRLKMSGTLLPVVSSSAALLDFGTIRTGEARALPLSVTLDTRLDQDAAPPMLISSNPDVLVGPVMQVISPRHAENSPNQDAHAERQFFCHLFLTQVAFLYRCYATLPFRIGFNLS